MTDTVDRTGSPADADALRIATIGTGVITRGFARAVTISGRARIVLAHSRDAQRAAQFAAEIGADAGESDLAAILTDDGVDAVYVASPNGVHAEQVRAALTAGKHVLCEKPLVLHAAEAEELFALADATGVLLVEAMRSAYDPGMQLIRDLLPQLGRVRRAGLRYTQRSSRYDRVLAGERVAVFDLAVGGGALNDLGVYTVHPLVDLFGEPQQVVGAPVLVGPDAEGAGLIVATYDGFVADLSYSKITASDLPSEIQGEKGTMTFDHIAMPRRIVVTPVGGEPVEHLIDGPLDDPQRGTDGNLSYEIDAFADAVAAGVEPAGSRERSLAAARVIDAARGA
ncbi:putative dehydrogenase [Kineosphaera limosa]|uniref:Uncharacterized protein n=1 Tax=Kineosphaera limosa NBRC 100340 TaxID=1184609 RepID=K6VI59_9MICO|nr:Gfo/Idh/MocA family oxidoreductase [Kineosphaera limosa]NYE01300.1 putative dehydrogenase [Kineosphaera limosa]GAB95903.1 hypothetical protein KILIM_029_00120 [Kineosphaera limosa NBRC 100340]